MTELPFQFVSASYITQIEALRSITLRELQQGLEQCSDSAIFNHTFQTLEQHHFLTEGFSNDFAQWALSALHQPSLAERFAGIDIRNYLAIEDVRADLVRIAATHGEIAASEPFHFCRTIEVVLPLHREARTLAGFRAGLERMSHSSFYFHFVASRLRLRLQSNDFSRWFREALNRDALARRTDRIDLYTNTLDSARDELIKMVDEEIGL